MLFVHARVILPHFTCDNSNCAIYYDKNIQVYCTSIVLRRRSTNTYTYTRRCTVLSYIPTSSIRVDVTYIILLDFAADLRKARLRQQYAVGLNGR